MAKAREEEDKLTKDLSKIVTKEKQESPEEMTLKTEAKATDESKSLNEAITRSLEETANKA